MPARPGAVLTFDLVRLSKGRVTPLRVSSALQEESSAAGLAADEHEKEKIAGHSVGADEACPFPEKFCTADGQGGFHAGGGCLLSLHPDAPFSKISVAQDESAISERERSELTEVLL